LALRHKPWARLEAPEITIKARCLAGIAHKLLLLFNSLKIVVQPERIYARVGFIGTMSKWAIIGNGQEEWSEK
jgi:hypothetical protein